MASSPSRPSLSHSVNTGVPPSQARQAKVYQIDFTAVASGKRIASSKRRVRWRFGFANPQALANGETGTACRGEEHDVTLVWSITSGKRLVLADGQEVHYSSSRNSIFDFSWTMRGNHVLKIVAHAAPPLSQQPGFRQYDFFVDGQSFFTFPKVFRLGLAPGAVSPPISPALLAERGERYYSGSDAARRSSASSTNIASIEAPNNPDEEEAYLQEAIRQSLQDGDGDKSTAVAAAKSTPSNDLLDFGSEPFEAATAATPPALSAPSTAAAAYGASYGGPGPDPFGYGAATSMPALPPSTTPAATPNPYAVPPASAAAAPADPWASMSMTSLPPQAVPSPGTDTATNGYRHSMPNLPPDAVLVSGTNGYGPAAATNSLALTVASTSASQPPQSASPWALPSAPAPPPAFAAPVAPAAVAHSPWAPPPPIATTQHSPYYNGMGGQFEAQPSPSSSQVPLAVTPQAQQTPSTIGFMSPPSDFAGFAAATPAPPVANDEAAAAPAPSVADPALFTMNTLSNGGYQQAEPASSEPAGSAADQAYAKLVNMDTFSLVSKTDAPRSNPFEFSSSMSSTIGGNQSLADIQAKKASSGPAKPVMNTPVPAPGAMVVSASQSGSYMASYGMQAPPTMMQQQSSQAYGMGQQPPLYGMPQQQLQPPPVGQSPYGTPQYQQQPAQPPYGGAYYGVAPPQQPPGSGYF